ncbi:hypothetical protein [Streptomyces tubercidicus]|uniref:hypothetical protein n=1 Tax=Streptomyces tubercidicus TaxID=47759 RepID=UPI003465D0C4
MATSATLGEGGPKVGPGSILEVAAQVFGMPFSSDALVSEERMTPEQFNGTGEPWAARTASPEEGIVYSGCPDVGRHILHTVYQPKPRKQVEQAHRNYKRAGQAPFAAGSRTATHSTCDVIGNLWILI